MNSLELLSLPLSKIGTGTNPRKHFDRPALDELIGSIREVGLLQPVVVRSKPGGEYELVAGERRFRACKELEFSEIQVVVRDVEDEMMAVVQVVENSAREGLSPLEEAVAVSAALTEKFGPDASQDEKRVWGEQLGWGLRKLQYALALANASDYVQFFGAPFSIYTKLRDDDGNVVLDEEGKPQRKRNEFPAMDSSLLKILVRCNNELRKFDQRSKKENGSHREVAERTIRRLAEKATLEGWSAKKFDGEAKRLVSSITNASKEPAAPKVSAAPVFSEEKIPSLSVAHLQSLDEKGRADAAKGIEAVLLQAGFRTVTILP